MIPQASPDPISQAAGAQDSLELTSLPSSISRDLPIRAILGKAQKALSDLGLEVPSLRYTMARDQKAPGEGLWIVFDATTHDPCLFGSEYSNARRVELLGQLYARLAGVVAREAGGVPFWIDASVSLIEPHSGPASGSAAAALQRDGLVDVHQDNDVEFSSLQEAIARGELMPGSCLEEYCTRYGRSDVLKHGAHYISPDPITLEALEVFMSARKISSFLEVGAGVGLSAVAAERNGLSDFRFVDKNPSVTGFLDQRHPGKAETADALDYKFDRHWDLVQIGIPYELQPWFLEKKGAELARHADSVVLQSACLTFFEFEHSWLMGERKVTAWPWYKPEQSIAAHFPYVMEAAHGFQSCIIASKTPLDDLKAEMAKRGFSALEYRRVSLP